jgi:hypothetical protein
MGFRARPGNGFDCTRERPAGALMGIMFLMYRNSNLVVYIRNTLRYWGGPEPRPRLGGCLRKAQAREKPGPYVEGELKGARLSD